MSEDAEMIERLTAKAAYLVQVARSLCPKPSEAAGVLGFALGMVSGIGAGSAEVSWDNPEFQRHMRRLYEHGQRLVRRERPS